SGHLRQRVFSAMAAVKQTAPRAQKVGTLKVALSPITASENEGWQRVRVAVSGPHGPVRVAVTEFGVPLNRGLVKDYRGTPAGPVDGWGVGVVLARVEAAASWVAACTHLRGFTESWAALMYGAAETGGKAAAENSIRFAADPETLAGLLGDGTLK